MKKALYVILLVVEFLLGTLALSYMALFTTWTFLFLLFIPWAVLAIWVLAKLKKADSEELKRKLKRRLALVMLLPLLAGIGIFVFFVVALSMVI